MDAAAEDAKLRTFFADKFGPLFDVIGFQGTKDAFMSLQLCFEGLSRSSASSANRAVIENVVIPMSNAARSRIDALIAEGRKMQAHHASELERIVAAHQAALSSQKEQLDLERKAALSSLKERLDLEHKKEQLDLEHKGALSSLTARLAEERRAHSESNLLFAALEERYSSVMRANKAMEVKIEEATSLAASVARDHDDTKTALMRTMQRNRTLTAQLREAATSELEVLALPSSAPSLSGMLALPPPMQAAPEPAAPAAPSSSGSGQTAPDNNPRPLKRNRDD